MATQSNLPVPAAKKATAPPASPPAGGGGTVGANTGAGAGATAAPMPITPPGQATGQLPSGVDPTAAVALNKFSETIVYEGGGPKFIWLPAINGPPQQQMVYGQTTYRATQSGEAQGMFGYPPVPPPAFDPSLLVNAPKFTRIGPTRSGRAFVNYIVRWTYTFESISPLIGFPHVWRT